MTYCVVGVIMVFAGACGGAAVEVGLGDAPSTLPQVDPADGPGIAIELRDAAVDALVIPDPQIAVEAFEAISGEDSIRLSVDNEWETIEVQATAANAESTEVRIFATPVRTEWAMGDGSTLVCVHATSPSEPEPPCNHTYAAVGTYEGTGSITWGLSWSVDDEYRGVFLTVASTTPFVVEQS